MFFFSKHTTEEKILIKNLKNILGFKPKNLSLYQDALRHSSVCNRQNHFHNNERLEYIGDAILTATVTHLIFPMFPKAKEGELTVIRSSIVSRKSLNKISNNLQLPKLLKMKQDKNNPMAGNNIAGNSLEALVGAIFLDRGYKYALEFTDKIIQNHFPDLKDYNKKKNDDNFKSALLSYSQKCRVPLEFITYENREANEFLSHFKTELFLDGKYLSEGKGWNKRDAEQLAAQKAIENLRKQNKSKLF